MYKIKLIDSKNKKEDRIIELFESIKKWLYSEELNYLVNLYGGNIDKRKSFEENIEYLSNFLEVWNFRGRINGLKERFNISYDVDQVIENNKDNVIKAIKHLDMIDGSIPSNIPEYILVLGGARTSNFKRPGYTRYIVDKLNLSNINVVALSTLRPISDVERDNLYTSDIVYEYDALSRGLELSFDIKDYNEIIGENENINFKSYIRKYIDKYNGNNIYSISAPSSNPNYRANTRDTFDFFLDKFEIKKNTSLLLVTSQIYSNYQFLKFVDLALEYDLNLECCGYSMDKSNMSINNYLQEIKSTVDATKVLFDKYKKILNEEEYEDFIIEKKAR